jgi:hypothetical protein
LAPIAPRQALLRFRAVHESLFDLSLAAFAAIGLPVTVCSSFAALIRVLQRASMERVSAAINVGTAVGFVLGILLAAVVS